MHAAIDWPLDRCRIRRGAVNHTYGPVRRNRDGSERNHQGWDFEAIDGTPCFAIADGRVVFAGERGALGKLIVIGFEALGRPLFAAYAHLQRLDVLTGIKVKRGQQIGLTGSTGNAAGMGPGDKHLHFEIRTVPLPGPGLDGRMSPIKVFGTCPLEHAAVRRGSL